jgi:hypothetical protein
MSKLAGVSMSNISEISESIKDTLKPEIEKWESEVFTHIKQLELYCKQTVYTETKGAIAIYQLKVKAGWNKGMERYFGYAESSLKALISKEAQAKLSKIDVAVAKLLKNEKIVTIEKLGFTFDSANSFCEGSWKINGEKVFSFRAIYAGGYNIQTLHIRTLYSYK